MNNDKGLLDTEAEKAARKEAEQVTSPVRRGYLPDLEPAGTADPVPRARPDMVDGTLTLLTPHAAIVRVPALPSASPARTARALGAALTLALIRAATQYRDASGKELDLSTEKPAFTATFTVA